MESNFKSKHGLESYLQNSEESPRGNAMQVCDSPWRADSSRANPLKIEATVVELLANEMSRALRLLLPHHGERRRERKCHVGSRERALRPLGQPAPLESDASEK